jgi:hypothetical protein
MNRKGELMCRRERECMGERFEQGEMGKMEDVKERSKGKL